jgi:hypothetical protein
MSKIKVVSYENLMSRKTGHPIELLLMEHKENQTCSVKMMSRMFPSNPELVFNMEQISLSSLEGRGVCPYCNVEKIEEMKSENSLELMLYGNLDGLDDLPYLLKLKFSAEPYRVKIDGEMLESSTEGKITAFNTCFMSHLFSDENHPPFEMARKSFAFFEGRGFSWTSDVERGQSEYHRGSDDGGPWIQLFKTRKFAQTGLSWSTSKEIVSLPLVGWVANDNSYMMTLASKNAYHVGIRWGPCLHSDVAAETDTRGNYPYFKSVVYIIPVNMDILMKMYKEDFDIENSWMHVSEDALWPYTPGILLGSFEGEDLNSCSVSQGTLTSYKSEGIWINSNLEKVAYPEGITEGKGSALWEIPAGKGEVILSRTLKLEGIHPITHISLDAVNRGKGEIEINVTVEADHQIITKKPFLLHYWANQRLLIPIPAMTKPENLNLSLRIRDREKPVRIVLDNIKGFTSCLK